MKLRFGLAMCLLVVSPTETPSFAQGYKGVEPIRSTRADVERLLGAPDAMCQCYIFKGERVRITYSEGPEVTWGPGRWDVPKGTVLEVEIDYSRGLRLKSLPIDVEQLDELRGSCVDLVLAYSDEGKGVTYGIEAGRVNSITYGPTAAQRRQYCSDPGDYIPGRPKQVHHVGSPPVCSSISADRTEIGIGESVSLIANAADPSGDVLSYTWTTTGGHIEGSGSSVTFDATELDPGEYVVTAQVNDGFGHTAECSITITVR
jgi:hypothetical protein